MYRVNSLIPKMSFRGQWLTRRVDHATAAPDQDPIEIAPPEDVKPFKQIPGPKLWPIIGCLPDYIKNEFNIAHYHKLWQKRYEDYGKESKIVKERVFHRQMVYVYSSTIAKQVYAQEGAFPMRPRIAFYSLRTELAENQGLPLSNGKQWKENRSHFNRKVLGLQAVEEYIPRINDVVDDYVNHVADLASSDREIGPDGHDVLPREVPNLLEENMKAFLEIMGSITLSTRLGGIRRGLDPSLPSHFFLMENKHLWDKTLKLDFSALQLFRYLPSKTYRLMKKHYLNMVAVGSQWITEHTNRMKDTLESSEFEAATAPDIYSYFLTRNISDVDVLYHIVDLMHASVDTVSNTFSILLYCLAANPEAQEKVYKEVTEVLQGDKVTAENLKELRYLKSCVREASRMYMVIPASSRVLDHDIVINGYNIPKGTYINMCFQTMCRDPNIFDKPNEYLPERWMQVRKEPELAFSHMPFGFGPRSCVGRRLVEQVLYILLANVVRTFRFENLSPTEPDLVWVGVSLSPKDPIRIGFHER